MTPNGAGRHPRSANDREPPRQSKEEIERECNFEWPGFRLGLPTFHFHGYIRRRLGVLSLDWFGSWSWKHCFAIFGSGSFAK